MYPHAHVALEISYVPFSNTVPYAIAPPSHLLWIRKSWRTFFIYPKPLSPLKTITVNFMKYFHLFQDHITTLVNALNKMAEFILFTKPPVTLVIVI